MLTIKNYVRAQSLDEAYELNQKKTACVMGGMMWLRMTGRTVMTMIDLCGLGLNKIEETETEFSIGAMVTLRQLETHPGLNAYTKGCMKKAVQDIVGIQFRNGATVGGSIYGRFGFSDVVTVFQAMDTYVEMHKGGIIPLAEFVKKPYDRDILVRIIVKKQPLAISYQAMRIQRTDFPVLTCAVSKLGDEYRAAIGARPSVAALIRDTEGILAAGINDDSAEKFAAAVAAAAKTDSNSRGSAEYRTHLAKVLTQRATLEIGGQL
ncbi:MAG: FAD binding domain-containing protein [Selenomonadaceae bacterium]|nr:FAD binding domain-containing protein [Selenomonadaceae bacterium]